MATSLLSMGLFVVGGECVGSVARSRGHRRWGSALTVNGCPLAVRGHRGGPGRDRQQIRGGCAYPSGRRECQRALVMPKTVTAVTHEGQDASLNIGDRQVLIGLDGEAERCWLHLLVFRLEVSGLLTNDRRLASQGDDLAGEESVAVARGTRVPLVGWRLLFPDVWDEAAWTALRTRALALAAVHGVSPTAAITTMDAVGRYFADTSQS